MPSSFKNSHFIGVPERKDGKAMFEFSPEGDCTVTIDGMLIAPLCVFSKRQISNIVKRVRKCRASNPAPSFEIERGRLG